VIPPLADARLTITVLERHDVRALPALYRATPGFFAAYGVPLDERLDAAVAAQWQRCHDAMATHQLLALRRADAAALIGVIEVRHASPAAGAVLLWMLITQSQQRRGYGQAALALLETWLIRQAAIDRLCALGGDNPEGHTFLELQGFHRTNDRAPLPVGSGEADIWSW